MAKMPIRPCLAIIALSFGVALMTGCGATPPANTPETEPVAGYLGLQEEFGNLDLSPFQGRSIVLDAGHGGFFRGAIGPEGLTEAEVNLGVVLYLGGLLRWAGAEAHLTRSADYDFLTPADSTLTRDLMFRSDFTDSLQPDVFLSIHHNSTASRDPDVNETQTYYPLGDDGASLDLARCIHRHLVLNLEITPAKILPGNFHVLRHATVPAVLGEPAMLSNPVMEKRLSLAASQELEAKAYFLGLLDYFSAGQPVWNCTLGDTVTWNHADSKAAVSWKFLGSEAPDFSGPGADPSSYHLTLNGVNQGFDLSADGTVVTWRPNTPLASGHHQLHLTGRNLKGRATPSQNTVLLVPPASRLVVQISNESPVRNNTGRTLLRWHTQDGQPTVPGFLGIDDHFRVPIPPASQGWFLLPTGQDVLREVDFQGRNGQPAVTLVPQISSPLPQDFHWRLVTMGEKPDFASSHAPDLGWHHRLPNRNSGLHPWTGGGSPAMIWQLGQKVWIEAQGFLPLIDPGGRDPLRTRTLDSEQEIWRSRLILPELFGRTIIIDPAGGGIDNDGTFPLGTRGADINLETARQVQLLLEGAGARVMLTRDAEVAPDPQKKVLLAGRKKADLFLTIAQARNSDPPSIAHHPGSRVGIRWARSMAQNMATLDSMVVGQSYAYLLRHTACPALEIRLGSPRNAADELVHTSLPRQMAVARGILLSCASVFSPGEKEIPTVDPAELLKLLPHGLPWHTVEWARWDGNFSWLPFSSQKASNSVISCLTPGWPAKKGTHTLEIHAGSQWQLWHVEKTDAGLDFEMMMENR